MNKLWQGVEANGDLYAYVHVEPSNNKRFKRDLNYQLMTDDLNSWISGDFKQNANQPVIVLLDNFSLLKPINHQSPFKSLDTAESSLFPSYLTPNYNSFWTFFQSPFKTLTNLNTHLSNWNPISNSIPNFNPINDQIVDQNQDQGYKASASTNVIKHASQEEAPVYLSAFVSNFRLDIYHNLDEIYDYLDRLSKIHKHIRVYTIGYSHESRPIKAVEIHQDIANLNKKMVYFDGNYSGLVYIMHAF